MIYLNILNNTFTSSLFDGQSNESGFTTRMAGDGRHIDTVLSLLRLNQIIFKKLVLAEQIHSANSTIFRNTNSLPVERIAETDALVTREKGVVLAVRTADCIPVIYIDREAGVAAVSHNGWRGTLKGISKHVIRQMCDEGASLGRIRVAIGPGIGACCYDIDEDRYYQFMEEFEDDFHAFSMRAGRRYMNLLKLNFEILKRAGVGGRNIDFFPFCTSCDKNRFYSYRRDFRKNRDKFGEMFSYIVLN